LTLWLELHVELNGQDTRGQTGVAAAAAAAPVPATTVTLPITTQFRMVPASNPLVRLVTPPDRLAALASSLYIKVAPFRPTRIDEAAPIGALPVRRLEIQIGGEKMPMAAAGYIFVQFSNGEVF